jgi:Histidine kinase/Histidine kinase-, DNA gyrase B-, and HSP90-like ATPase
MADSAQLNDAAAALASGSRRMVTGVGERTSRAARLRLPSAFMRTTLSIDHETGHRPVRRIWILAGSVVLATAVLIPVYRLQKLSWLEALAAAATFVVPCVLLGWVVWRLLMRPPRLQSRTGGLVVHVATAIAFSITWTLPLFGLAYLLRKEVSLDFLRGGGVWQLALGLVIYCVLLFAARAQHRLREQELAAANAELQALRAQLDPHFLFNTLHSLTQLAREDPVATEDALQRFGELMRYVLKCGRETRTEIALEQELEFVRNYLALERLRLGERLRVIEHIDPDTLELGVPALLLQPLVENAVRHGLAPRRDGGTVRLSSTLAHDRLMVSVGDDGSGAEAGQIGESKGLGLKAVARQLHAHFPMGAEFAIETQPRAGFMVQLTMPARLPGRGSRDAQSVRSG